MFQPQPTPFASTFHAPPSSSSSSSYVLEADLPYYHFSPTPLGALQTGGGRIGDVPGPGRGGARAGPGLGSGSRQQQQHQKQLQQQQQVLQSLYESPPPAATTAAAAAAAAVAAAANFHHTTAASPNSSLYNHRSRPSTTMDHNDAGSLPDDLAAQEAAAREYQPQLEGPLVGEKTTSDVITEEYAKADQIYVEKTINLPQTYSHYRQVQGDGNCGWRAIGFCYFENLVNAGDRDQIEGEVARITSFNQLLLNAGGYDRFLFEDMVDETITLLKALANSVANRAVAMAILMQKFNDRDSSNAIIYHLRLLASSWLKANAGLFEPFIPEDLGIAGYCSNNIERVDREIDHLGITLLVEVLLKPLQIVLEIAYLDRSPGSEVNIYRFPDEANGQPVAALGPMIYLLYRPDHYDILYRPMLDPTPVSLQVNKVASFSHRDDIASPLSSMHPYTSVDYTPLAVLPGFSGPPAGLSPLSPTSATSPMTDGFDTSPHSQWLPTHFADTFQQAMPPPPAPSTATAPLPPAPPPAAAPAPQQQPQTQQSAAPTKAAAPVSYPLRFSPQCFHLNNTVVEPSFLPNNSFQEPSFSTPPLKNSHFNKAHFNNPHFHPEQWTPEDDTPERICGTKKKVRPKGDN